MHSLKAKFAVVSVFALFAAGCLGAGPGGTLGPTTSTVATAPGPEGNWTLPTTWHGIRAPDLVVGGNATGLPVILQSSEGFPGFGFLPFGNEAASQTFASIRGGTIGPREAWAGSLGGKVMVAATARSTTGGDPLLAAWPLWAVFDGTWTLEESPARWMGRYVGGLQVLDGRAYVLVNGKEGRELWDYDGASWQSRKMPTLNALRDYAMGQYHGYLVFLGFDLSFATVVVRLDPKTWQEEVVTLEPSKGASVSTFVVGVSRHEPPLLSWSHVRLGADDRGISIALLGDSGWTVSKIDAGDRNPETALRDAGRSLIITSGPDGTRAWAQNGTWRQCSGVPEIMRDSSFLLDATAAYVTHNPGRVLVLERVGFDVPTCR